MEAARNSGRAGFRASALLISHSEQSCDSFPLRRQRNRQISQMLRGPSVFGFVVGSFAVAGCILSCLLFLLEAGHPKSFFFFSVYPVSNPR